MHISGRKSLQDQSGVIHQAHLFSGGDQKIDEETVSVEKGNTEGEIEVEVGGRVQLDSLVIIDIVDIVDIVDIEVVRE